MHHDGAPVDEPSPQLEPRAGGSLERRVETSERLEDLGADQQGSASEARQETDSIPGLRRAQSGQIGWM